MIKKIFKQAAILFFMIFVCTLASAKGKGDVGLVGETNPQIEEQTDLLEEEQQEAVEEKEPVQLYTLRPVEGKPVGFAETWGYVSAGREDEYDSNLPITDVCYFSAEINCYGELSSVPV